MSCSVSAVARVNITFVPDTVTGLLDARSSLGPLITVTVNALAAGVEFISSVSLYFSSSVAPSTVRSPSSGGVSTLCPDCAVFAAWVSAASTRLATILVMNLIAPPLSDSESAAQEMPSASLSPAATV